VARDTPITADNFAGHLAALHERIGDRRREIEARPPEPRPTKSGVFTGVPDSSRQLWAVIQAAKWQDEFDPVDPKLAALCERAMARLGRDWFEAVQRGDTATVRAYIEEGFPMSHRHPTIGANALHMAAGSQARPLVRLLLPLWEGFTLRDGQGRLASELAYLYGEDPAMARLLGRLERREAAQTGGVVRRRLLS
jgi:hypothetical protein